MTNVYDHRSFSALLTSSEKDQKNLGRLNEDSNPDFCDAGSAEKVLDQTHSFQSA